MCSQRLFCGWPRGHICIGVNLGGCEFGPPQTQASVEKCIRHPFVRRARRVATDRERCKSEQNTSDWMPLYLTYPSTTPKSFGSDTRGWRRQKEPSKDQVLPTLRAHRLIDWEIVRFLVKVKAITSRLPRR